MGYSVLEAIQKLNLEDTLFVSKEGTERYGSDPEWDYGLLKSHQQWVRDAIVLSQRTEESFSGTLSDQSKGLATRILAKSFYVPRDPVAHSALLKRLLLAEAALACHLDSLVPTIAATKGPDSLWAMSCYWRSKEGFHDWIRDVKQHTSESSLLYSKLLSASECLTLPVVDADSAKTQCQSMVLGGDIDISSQFAWSIIEQALAAYVPILDAHGAAIDSLNSDIAELDSTIQKIEYDARMTSYLSERTQIYENADSLSGLMGRYSGKQLLAVLGVPAWLSIWLPVVQAEKEAVLAREAAAEAEMKAWEELDRAQKAEKALDKADSLEVSSMRLREALYAQAISNSNGDEHMIHDEYLRLNAQELALQAKRCKEALDEHDRQVAAAYEKDNLVSF